MFSAELFPLLDSNSELIYHVLSETLNPANTLIQTLHLITPTLLQREISLIFMLTFFIHYVHRCDGLY